MVDLAGPGLPVTLIIGPVTSGFGVVLLIIRQHDDQIIYLAGEVLLTTVLRRARASGRHGLLRASTR